MRTTLSATFPLFSLALGAVNWSAFESCITQSGTSSVQSVSTSTSTTTVVQPNVYVKHTVHPQHFYTPLPFTKTWTHTFQETDTAVSTVTIQLTTEVFNPTSTAVSTVTQTHVSEVYTTIPVPSGFLPVSNTTNATYPAVGSSSSSTIASFSTTAANNMSSTAVVSASASVALEARNGNGKGSVQKQYAHAVNCLKSIMVQTTIDSTITGTTQTSTVAQPTTTLTVTTTSTTMVQPKHGHGKTIYTTSWTTVTKNITVHSTTTATAEVTSTVKAYAACQTNNLLSSVASISAVGSETLKYNTTAASSAEKCCEQCMGNDECTGSAYQISSPFGGECLIYYSNSCASQSAYSLEYTTSSSGGEYTVSNGLCGYMFSGGQEANKLSNSGHGKGQHGHGF